MSPVTVAIYGKRLKEGEAENAKLNYPLAESIRAAEAPKAALSRAVAQRGY